MLCSSLRQDLTDERGARRVAAKDLHDAQVEVQDLQAQLAKLQQEQQVALDNLRQQMTEEKAAEKKILETDSEAIINNWIKYYDNEIAQLHSKLDQAQQSHGSSGASSARLEAELASARQQIAELQKVKTEEGAAEQRFAQAQSRISQLETCLSAATAEAVSSSQAVQEARKETESVQSQCSRANERCDALQKQLEDDKQHFQKVVETTVLQTAEHAKQYLHDIERAKSQQGNYHDSGGRGHKRSRRDSSNGRDSKRKS